MFTRKMIEDAGHDWERKSHINEAIHNLRKLKLSEIRVEGPLAKSKIAWKVKKLSQSFIHRLCELSDGCYITWASSHYLSSIILARCIIETSAVMWHFEEKIKTCLDAGDLDKIDKTVMHQTFSTRIEGMLGEENEYKAQNILGIIQKQDKKIKGFLSVYENMSEAVHPNHFGLSQVHGEINYEDGTVTFGEPRFTKAMFSSISCAFMAIAISCDKYIILEDSINKIAQLQHK